jgi:hypothetical protein
MPEIMAAKIVEACRLEGVIGSTAQAETAIGPGSPRRALTL